MFHIECSPTGGSDERRSGVTLPKTEMMMKTSSKVGVNQWFVNIGYW
jgi:hypothetical protein